MTTLLEEEHSPRHEPSHDSRHGGAGPDYCKSDKKRLRPNDSLLETISDDMRDGDIPQLEKTELDVSNEEEVGGDDGNQDSVSNGSPSDFLLLIYAY